MATTRKIKEAKDLSSGELIYFKGHAKATFMSDGSTVEDTINNIESKIDLSDLDERINIISKNVDDNEFVTASALTDLNDRIISLENQIITLNELLGNVSSRLDAITNNVSE